MTKEQKEAEIARLETCIRDELEKLELWGKGGNWVLCVTWRTYKAYSSELLLPCLDIEEMFGKRQELRCELHDDEEEWGSQDAICGIYKRVHTWMGEYHITELLGEEEVFPIPRNNDAKEWKAMRRGMAEREKEEWQKLKAAKENVVEVNVETELGGMF